MLSFLYDRGVLLGLEVRLNVPNFLVECAANTLQRRGRTIHGVLMAKADRANWIGDVGSRGACDKEAAKTGPPSASLRETLNYLPDSSS